jgi:glycerol-3-phosphate dehydrogenase
MRNLHESLREKNTKTTLGKKSAIMSIEEYRKMLNDYGSTDEKIIQRIEYMEALCRNVIRIELEKVRVAYQVKK